MTNGFCGLMTFMGLIQAELRSIVIRCIQVLSIDRTESYCNMFSFRLWHNLYSARFFPRCLTSNSSTKLGRWGSQRRLGVQTEPLSTGERG